MCFVYRFLQDANLSSTAHSHALDSLKTQLKQHQSLLEQERETFQSRQQESAERESRLQAELTQVSMKVCMYTSLEIRPL